MQILQAKRPVTGNIKEIGTTIINDHTLMVSGLGFDGDRGGIIERIEDSNIYSFSAGL